MRGGKLPKVLKTVQYIGKFDVAIVGWLGIIVGERTKKRGREEGAEDVDVEQRRGGW